MEEHRLRLLREPFLARDSAFEGEPAMTLLDARRRRLSLLAQLQTFQNPAQLLQRRRAKRRSPRRLDVSLQLSSYSQ